MADRNDDQRSFVDDVNEDMGQFLQLRRDQLKRISPEATSLVDVVMSLAEGGKRMRARLCEWGYRAAAEQEATGRAPVPDAPTQAPAVDIVRAGTALELFQTAAVIHDDILDRSDTRRNVPSAHRNFHARHGEAGWGLDAEHFGSSAAILAGDLCLCWSEEAFASIGAPTRAATEARAAFDQMRLEVLAGQYLDIVEEVAGAASGQKVADAGSGQEFAGGGSGQERTQSEAIDRAMTVVSFKAARYSVERPLVIGAALGGASAELTAQLSEVGLAIGEAFQLRDDLLGVFGDPEVTGKPAGDDLREGKRTVLIAAALEATSGVDRAVIQGALGDPELTTEDIERLRNILTQSGAASRVETMIDQRRDQALALIAQLPVSESAQDELTDLTHRLVTRPS